MRSSKLLMATLAIGLSLSQFAHMPSSGEVAPDPYKPKRRSKGEKKRNKAARYHQ